MRRILIIVLTLITAAIHVYFYTTGPGLVFSGPDRLFTFFLLNALGYLGLLGLLYLPLGLPAGIHRLVRPVFIGYTILTIVLYIIISAQSGVWSVPWAPIAKIDEAILTWLLWSEGKAQMPVSSQQKSDAML
ncbi:MAG TPA: hypothetical protein VLD65_10530 [Anaerolineales bacterium]|nr:hypothetical protein [Anaerolineales bacterium]